MKNFFLKCFLSSCDHFLVLTVVTMFENFMQIKFTTSKRDCVFCEGPVMSLTLAQYPEIIRVQNVFILSVPHDLQWRSPLSQHSRTTSWPLTTDTSRRHWGREGGDQSSRCSLLCCSSVFSKVWTENVVLPSQMQDLLHFPNTGEEKQDSVSGKRSVDWFASTKSYNLLIYWCAWMFYSCLLNRASAHVWMWSGRTLPCEGWHAAVVAGWSVSEWWKQRRRRGAPAWGR